MRPCSLSCSLIVHPKARKAHAERVDQAIADLRYGTIGVNAWAGASCALMGSVIAAGLEG